MRRAPRIRTPSTPTTKWKVRLRNSAKAVRYTIRYAGIQRTTSMPRDSATMAANIGPMVTRKNAAISTSDLLVPPAVAGNNAVTLVSSRRSARTKRLAPASSATRMSIVCRPRRGTMWTEAPPSGAGATRADKIRSRGNNRPSTVRPRASASILANVSVGREAYRWEENQGEGPTGQADPGSEVEIVREKRDRRESAHHAAQRCRRCAGLATSASGSS